MRIEHVVISIIIFIVVLLAILVLAGKVVPTFDWGVSFLKQVAKGASSAPSP